MPLKSYSSISDFERSPATRWSEAEAMGMVFRSRDYGSEEIARSLARRVADEHPLALSSSTSSQVLFLLLALSLLLKSPFIIVYPYHLTLLFHYVHGSTLRITGTKIIIHVYDFRKIYSSSLHLRLFVETVVGISLSVNKPHRGRPQAQ